MAVGRCVLTVSITGSARPHLLEWAAKARSDEPFTGGM
jgi:hypothetical protein